MTIIPAHHGSDDLTADLRDQEEIGIVIHLALNIRFGIIPGMQQIAALP